MSVTLAVRGRQRNVGIVSTFDFLCICGQNVAHHYLMAVCIGAQPQYLAVRGNDRSLGCHNFPNESHLIGQNLNRFFPVRFHFHQDILFVDFIPSGHKYLCYCTRRIGIHRIGAVRARHDPGSGHRHRYPADKCPNNGNHHDHCCPRQGQPGHWGGYFQHRIQLIR